VRRGPSNFVLAYQCPDDTRRDETERFWGGVADVLAFSIVWGAVGTLIVALLGAVVLWGVLIANAAR
jgi:hypothetical protein